MGLEAGRLGKLAVEGLALLAEVAVGGDGDQESLAMLRKVHAGEVNGSPDQGSGLGRLGGVMTLPPLVSQETKQGNGSNDDGDISDQIQAFHRTCLQAKFRQKSSMTQQGALRTLLCPMLEEMLGFERLSMITHLRTPPRTHSNASSPFRV